MCIRLYYIITTRLPRPQAPLRAGKRAEKQGARDLVPQPHAHRAQTRSDAWGRGRQPETLLYPHLYIIFNQWFILIIFANTSCSEPIGYMSLSRRLKIYSFIPGKSGSVGLDGKEKKRGHLLNCISPTTLRAPRPTKERRLGSRQQNPCISTVVDKTHNLC